MKRTQKSQSATDPGRGGGVPGLKYMNESVAHPTANGRVTDNTSMTLMQQCSNIFSNTLCLTKSCDVHEPSTGLRQHQGRRTNRSRDVVDKERENKRTQRHERSHDDHLSNLSTRLEEKMMSQNSTLSLPLLQCSSGGNGEKSNYITGMDEMKYRGSPPIQIAEIMANGETAKTQG